MKMDWNPSRVAFLDFETQSYQELTTTRKYVRHPSTTVLTCCVKVDGQMLRMGPYLTPSDKQTLAKVAESHTIVAHNAPFDSAVWDAAGLPEARWFDTLPCTRAAGLPGGLDKAGSALGLGGKDKNGEALIKMLCILKLGKPAPAVGPAHELLLRYNERDVELLEKLYERVKGFVEPSVLTVDRTINDRGVNIDTELLAKLKVLYETNARVNSEEIRRIDAELNVRSSKQMREYLASRGVELYEDAPDGGRKYGTSKQLVNSFLQDPLKYATDDPSEDAIEEVKELLELRREVVGVGAGKVKNAEEVLDDDGRIRDLLVYYGGHLGRWASRRLQLHNMPSSQFGGLDIRSLEPEYAAVAQHAAKTSEIVKQHVTVSEVINLMLRRLISYPNLLVADWNAVEARCVAWMSQDDRMMGIYNDPLGQSPYLDMGRVMFRRKITKKTDPAEYQLAKGVCLGCNYGMSGAKFERQVSIRESRATLDMLRSTGVDLKEAVKQYRERYPSIPALWYALDRAVKACVVDGREARCGRCTFHRVGSDMHIVLPSGRPIVYRNVRVQMLVPAYCAMYGMPEEPRPTVVFDGPRGVGFLYGSKVCENVSQGTCRDILAEKLVHCDQLGFTTAFHVHDEIVNADDPDRLDEMGCMMSEPPAWAEGFPLMVEAYSGPQWTKNSAGYVERTYFNGRRIK